LPPATKIQSRYAVSKSQARYIAIKALDALEAHGGSSKDSVQVKRMIEVVVGSWLKNGNL
jgi:hypothetical protein